MRTIAKPFLSAGALLLLVLLGPALLLNLWLLLPGSRSQVLGTIGAVTQSPVTLRGLYAVPLLGFTANGVRAEPGIGAPFIGSAESVTIRTSLGNLLRGRLSISSVVLDHPVVTMTLPTAGRLPGITATSPGQIASPSTSIPGAGSPTPSSTITTATTPSAPTAVVKTPRSGEGSSPFTSSTHVNVRGGEFHLTGPSSLPLLDVSGLNVSDRGNGKGTLSAEGVTVSSLLRFSDVKAETITSPESILFTNIAASLGGGQVTGHVDYLGPFSSNPGYRTDLRIEGADLGHLLSDISLGNTQAQGKVSGSLSLQGSPGIGSTMRGSGEIRCRETVIKPVDFLQQVGRLLSIQELQILRLAEGRCLYRIEEGHVVVDELFLRSQNICLAAKGPVGATGDLDLDARILLNENLASRLRGILGPRLAPAPEPGYSQISFRVTGPPSRPRTDLLERLTGIRIGGDLGGLGNLLQGLGIFGKPPAAAPAPTAVPVVPGKP